MKKVLWIFIIASFLLYAEPLHDLLGEYARCYHAVSLDCEKIANAIETEFPRTHIAMDENKRIVDVLRGDEIKDTVISGNHKLIRKEGHNEKETIKLYNYDSLDSLREGISRMINASVPEINFYTKSIKVKENFLNSGVFQAHIGEFKYNLQFLIEMVSVIRKEDSLFLSQYGRLEKVSDLHSWQKWYKIIISIKNLEVEQALQKFEARYGDKSEKVNLLELLMINFVPPFKGNTKGPSALEPILRFTPVCYDFTGAKFVKTFQIGVNYYFFGENILKHLNHIGIAFLLTDVKSEKIYEVNTLSIGGMIHLGKYQIGVVKDNSSNGLKLISTIDFQLIPLLF